MVLSVLLRFSLYIVSISERGAEGATAATSAAPGLEVGVVSPEDGEDVSIPLSEVVGGDFSRSS